MYTVEIYKTDRRTKAGERLVEKRDVELTEAYAREWAERHYPASKGYRFEVHQTYVTRTSLVGGQEFQERYDTPYYCSPSSETYWSM